MGFSRGEVAAMNAEFESLWQESVEAEVNRRLAARGFAMEVQQAHLSGQIPAGRDVVSVQLTSDVDR